MPTKSLSAPTIQKVEAEISRFEDRANINKRRADVSAIMLIVLGALSGMLIVIPDKALDQYSISFLRQIFPILTAAIYSVRRYFCWQEKHRWYWARIQRQKGLLIRSQEGDSAFSREVANGLNFDEPEYPATPLDEDKLDQNDTKEKEA
jgi:hypothetical protein